MGIGYSNYFYKRMIGYRDRVRVLEITLVETVDALVATTEAGENILDELKAAQAASIEVGLIGMIGSPAWIAQIKQLQKGNP